MSCLKACGRSRHGHQITYLLGDREGLASRVLHKGIDEAAARENGCMRQARSQQLIDCHDCGQGVSFSAQSCPHCGSTEPAGSPELSPRALRKLRVEETNDRRLIIITLLCCGLGVLYGAVMSPGGSAALWSGLGFGFVGAVIGVPAAFIINVSRNLFD